METNHLLAWNPSIKPSEINKSALYTVSLEDFEDVEVSPYTVFFPPGSMTIKMSGARLYYMLNKKAEQNHKKTLLNPNKKPLRKSLKNVCFKSSVRKQQVSDLLSASIKMPKCMLTIFNLLQANPRGGQYYNRFVFNCYIGNVFTCTRCDKKCIADALLIFYMNDDKCVREVNTLFFKKEKIYSPPNCVKIKQASLCSAAKKCFGNNPLCNF
ncbi:late expression factor 2 [Adoxophyes honmai nucleopolyhedrovirus]|uniref:Late expression factor 2 n=1 Tax=Adoxophyes honmai nucleopolyhedrovirus TaxID=224399 RepID=Q80LJ6_NPVAH|nr:late expression factor 2 [Adoxophyes honmai nucleopolyhedrovirus]BAC67351.1 late expression factor 2 [Adoxophyes honmai nucleopolyhedrovirus]